MRDERDAVYPTRRHQPWVIEYLGQTLLIRKRKFLKAVSIVPHPRRTGVSFFRSLFQLM